MTYNVVVLENGAKRTTPFDSQEDAEYFAVDVLDLWNQEGFTLKGGVYSDAIVSFATQRSGRYATTVELAVAVYAS